MICISLAEQRPPCKVHLSFVKTYQKLITRFSQIYAKNTDSYNILQDRDEVSLGIIVNNRLLNFIIASWLSINLSEPVHHALCGNNF